MHSDGYTKGIYLMKRVGTLMLPKCNAGHKYTASGKGIQENSKSGLRKSVKA